MNYWVFVFFLFSSLLSVVFIKLKENKSISKKFKLTQIVKQTDNVNILYLDKR